MEIQKFTPQQILGPLNDVEVKNAPECLFTAGDVTLLQSGARVSVIGTRHPTREGIKRAETLSKMLCEHQVIVVSGLAEGIDTVAHRSAIENKGRTIAVLGTPLSETFPKSNVELQKQIIRDYLAISQFPTGYPSRPANFPMRNRTMALVSHATVIVEAGESSGTLHQGWEALRLGRPLFLLESLLKNPAMKWPQEMISYGAHVLTKETLGNLFEVIPQGTLSADLPF